MNPQFTGICTRKTQDSQPSSPQGAPVEIDSMFDDRYNWLRRRLHPAIAAVIAHQDVTTDLYHHRPLVILERVI